MKPDTFAVVRRKKVQLKRNCQLVVPVCVGSRAICTRPTVLSDAFFPFAVRHDFSAAVFSALLDVAVTYFLWVENRHFHLVAGRS